MKKTLPFVCLVVMLAVTCFFTYCSKDRNITGLEEKDYTGTISGSVFDKHGTPLRNVFVCIDADSATPAVSDARGEFSLGRVKAGTHTLHFAHPDYDDDTLHTITLSKGEDVVMHDTAKLPYSYYIIAGRILHKGTGVPLAGVVLEGYPCYAIAGSDGRYIIDRVKKNSVLKLLCARTGIGFGTKTVKDPVSDDTTIADITIDSSGATVSGTVYDSLSKPRADMVVSAVGRGLVDTTDADGRYMLENVPSGSAVQISVWDGEKTILGSVSGVRVNNGAFLPDVDITLGTPANISLYNGMALEVSNVIVADDAPGVILSVVPHYDSVTFIASYEWTLTGKDSIKTTTKMPFFSISMDSLVELGGKTSQQEITVIVNAVNREQEKSRMQTFMVRIRSEKPTLSAGVSASGSGEPTDSVSVYEGEQVWFTGKAFAPLGGIDNIAWSFGDKSIDLKSTDSIPLFWYSYQKAGIYKAVFKVTYGVSKVVRDTVKITVSASPLARPANPFPPDSVSVVVDSDSMLLTWHPASGTGVSYIVYLDTSTSQPKTPIDTTSDTSLVVSVKKGSTYFWRVEAHEGNQPSYGTIWRFTVSVNNPPAFVQDPGDMLDSATVGKSYKDTVGAADSDEDTVKFAFIDSVSGMKLSKGIITWTPMRADTGTRTVSLLAKDNKDGNDTLTWTITVYDTLAKPVNCLPADSGIAAVTGGKVTLKWHPVIGIGISYIVYLDTGISIPRTPVDTVDDTVLAVSVNSNSNKAYFWRVEAHKGKLTTNGPVWQFKTTNRPPVFIQDPGDMLDSATVGKPYRDTVGATDANGDTVTFAFKDSIGRMALNKSKGIITWTPVKADTGTGTVSILAKDNKGGLDTLEWTITIRDSAGAVRQYTVTFDSQRGSAVAARTVNEGDTVRTPAAPTRTGYTFGGWYKEAGCTNVWNFATETVTAAVTLYAKWTIKQYTVTFNSRGGDSVTAQTVNYGDTVTTPAAPTRTNYTFGGWYKETACTNAWNFATDTITAARTLYAKWTIIQYTVTFNSRGGSAVTAQTVNSGGKATTPAAPTRTGYTPGGWYKDSACTNVWNFATETVTEAVTLYAKWTINQYTVTFNSQGGSAVTAQTVNYGDTVTIPAAPTRTNYTFGGWYKEAACTDAWHFATDSVKAARTLYAKWTGDPFTITFDKNDGDASGTMAAQTIACGASVNLIANGFTKPGWTFTGWATTSGGAVAYADGVSYTMGPAAVTLYAKWTRDQYTVSFDSQDGSAVDAQTVSYEGLVTEPEAPTRTGFTFGGWYKEAECTYAWNFTTETVSGTMTLYAKWTASEVVTDIDGNTYTTVTIGTQTWLAGNLKTTTLNDGTPIPQVTDSNWSHLTTPEYCWYDNDSTYASTYGALYNWHTVNTGMLAPVGWHVATDADWITLINNLGGEAGGKLKEAGFAHWTSPNAGATNETGFSALPGGSRDRYSNFYDLGTDGSWWSATEGSASGAYEYGMSCDDASVYQGTGTTGKVNGFSIRCLRGNPTVNTVTFNAQGGSPVAPKTVISGNRTTAPAAPTRGGDIFVWWYKEPTCENSWLFENEPVTGNVTLYAKWVAITDSFSYNGNFYHAVTIGTQTWTLENLKTTSYNDGTPIPQVTGNAAWTGLSTPGYCWYNNDSITYATTYGALYNWWVVDTTNPKRIAPAGWHVPTDSEWTTLSDFLGVSAGGMLKERGLAHWTSPNTGATNETGFSALPGGYRGDGDDGDFLVQSLYGYWWSATEYDASGALSRGLYYTDEFMGSSSSLKGSGFSVRLVRD